MHNHFERGINLEQIILEFEPVNIVECGAGNGELTRKIEEFRKRKNFMFTVISDYKPSVMSNDTKFIEGISYIELGKEEDDSIDLLILDTDHNYWTLMKELASAFNKVREGGLIAMHDVDTFYHDSGMAMTYGGILEYPKEEIEKYLEQGGTGIALIDFLQMNKKRYKLLRWTEKFCGAALIQKKSVAQWNCSIPEKGAIYAKA